MDIPVAAEEAGAEGEDPEDRIPSIILKNTQEIYKMEELVRKYANQISAYYNKKSKKTKLNKLLNQHFFIFKRSQNNMDMLSALLKQYGIKIFNADNEELDLTDLSENLYQAVYSVSISSDNTSIPSKEINLEKEIPSNSSGTVSVINSKVVPDLFDHQIKAIKALENYFGSHKSPIKGLLVLPTGGGKTTTSAYWILKNFINKKKKVIWIAHRHELLEQAKHTFFKLSTKGLLTDIEKYRFRIISGLDTHDKPKDIDKNDDIIIASKDSLRHGRDHLIKKFLAFNKEVLLVIDEAHHATAGTYTDLIEIIQKNTEKFDILGLTATPFRTLQKEEGYLKIVFKDGILFSEDMQNLIIQKILAKPKFHPVETEEIISLSENDIFLIQQRSNLPENVAESIALRKKRNHTIVNNFDLKKYGKTIVFALNQFHAIELNKLFTERGFRCDFVVSGIHDPQLAINFSPSRNREIIQKFKDNELDVLINVEILTEGVDIPDVQSVFLTRPTISKNLMNQMVGRVLRGPRAKGTAEANIVFFIDNWEDKINWISPKELFGDESAILTHDENEYKKQQIQSISIRLIEMFTKLLDDTIESSQEMRALPANYMIPVGWYSFSLEKSSGEEESVFSEHKILVFQNQFESYMSLEKDMKGIFKRFDINGNLIFDGNEKDQALKYIQKKYFENIYSFPEYKPEDILNFLEYYSQNNHQTPPYFTFEARDEVDISKVASEISQNDSRKFQINRINELWDLENSIWKELFSNNKERFISIIDAEIRKIEHPELYKDTPMPDITYDNKLLEDLPLNKWPDPERSYLREKVFNAAGIPKGERKGLEIDHIVPMRDGGKTVFENLQVLTIKENRLKG